ncbi:Uncharacterised protein [Vibrio cholerae]|nr:Uncharacterised protein [Vibrio cholerae]
MEHHSDVAIGRFFVIDAASRQMNFAGSNAL